MPEFLYLLNMTRPFLIFVAFACCPLSAAAQVNFTDSNLPIVVINTNNQVIQDSVRIIADFGIRYNGPGIRNYMTDPFQYSGKISIEIRGSTSQQYPKVSYGFETKDALLNKLDTALLGMPKENDWILYGAYPDKSLMRNEITYDIFRQMGHYDVRYRYCELVINNQYRGVYSLMERIKRDKHRVDIAKLTPADTTGDQLTGGYIMKVDKLTGSSSSFFASPYDPKVKYLWHDPEDSELHPDQKNYIQNYIIGFENLMNGPNWNNYITGYNSKIEVNTFIDFMLMQELGRTVDGYRSSSFLYKEKDSLGGLLRAGPMWDFNLSYGNADYCDAYDTAGYQVDFNQVCPSFTSAVPFWWKKFLLDTNYTHLMKCRWTQLRNTVLHTDSVNARIDSMAQILYEAQQRNFSQWQILGVYVNWNYFVGQTWQEELDYLKLWTEARSKWLDTHLPGYCWDLGTAEHPKPDFVAHQLYPNPAGDRFFLDVYEPFRVKNATFRLFDMTGNAVMGYQHISENRLLVNRNGLAPGIYFYMLEQDGKQVVTGKIVLQ